MDITQYVIAAILAAVICILFSVLGKLLLNYVSLKTVSAIFKKSDDMIFNKTVKRAYKFGLLADLIGYLSAVIIFFIISEIETGFIDIGIGFLIVLFAFFESPVEKDLRSWIFVIIAVVISMIVTFIFNYFIILKATNLTKKQRLISSIIIALITAPYYFLIPLDWGKGLP